MAWTYWPLTADSDIYDQRVYQEMDRQIAMRMTAAGAPIWPPQSWPWDTGIIGSMTTTTMTDNSDPPKSWCMGARYVGTEYSNPWSCSDGNSDETPTSWYLVAHHCDPTKSIKVRITGWTENTLSYDSIADYETSGQGALSDFAGKHWTIIRGDRGYGSHERLLQWVNDNERAAGDVVTATTSSVTVTVRNGRGSQIKPRFRVNEHVGSDLLVYAGGTLRRVTITANTRDTITYATQSWMPDAGALYIVLKAGRRGYPGRAPQHLLGDYAGYKVGYQTHLPDDSVGSISMPVARVHIPGADVLGSCSGRDVRAWDYDFISQFPSDPFDLLCGAIGDKMYAPFYYRTWRARQQALESAAASYVRNSSFEGSKGITPLTPAGAFKAADINWAATTSTTVEVTGDATSSNTLNHGSIDYPYFPIEVCWVLTDGTDNNYKSGYGLAVSNTQLVSHTADLGLDVFAVATDESKTLTISWMWTRFQERMVRRLRPITGWVPSVDGFPLAAVDPATILDEDTCHGRGAYRTRPASTHYLERAPQSAFAEVNNPDVKGFTIDGPDGIGEGDLFRYLGDDAFGPSIQDQSGGFISEANPLTPYYGRYRTANSAPETQRQINADMRGEIVSGTTTQFTTTKDFWDHHWFAGNPAAHVEQGVATSGSTTSLTDSAKAGSCFWRAADFDDGIFVHFPVEVIMNGDDLADPENFDDPDAVIEKSLVTAGTELGQLTFSPALSASANGKAWRIREPHSGLVSYLRGLPVRVTRTNPDTGAKEVETVTILGHDDTTVFVEALPWAADEAMSFEIVVPIIGGVYRVVDGAYELAAGDDEARVSVSAPQPFRRDPKNNNPDIVVRYGRGVLGDSISREGMNELYRFALALKRTIGHPSWTNDPTGEDPEKNSKSSAGGNHSDWPNAGGWWDQMMTCMLDGCDPLPEPWFGPGHTNGPNVGWAGRTANQSDGPPLAVCDGTGIYAEDVVWVSGANSAGECSARRRYSYAQVAIPQPFCKIGNKIAWYAKAGITAGDPDEGGVCIPGPTEFANNTWREYRFNGQGTSDGLLYRQYHMWDQETSYTTSEDIRTSASLGLTQLDPPPQAIAYPTPVDCPSVLNVFGEMFPPRITVTEGYYVLDVIAVVEWNF